MMTNSPLITCLLIKAPLSLLVFGSTLAAMAAAAATSTTTTTTSVPTKPVQNTHPIVQRVVEQTPPLIANGTTSGNIYNISANSNNLTNLSRQNSGKAIKQIANRLEQESPEAVEAFASIQTSLPKRGDNSSLAPILSPSNGSDLIRQDQSSGNNNMLTQTKGAQTRITSRGNRLREYKLPSWFNYALYKHFYGKRYSDRRENELRKRIYLRTALRVFEQRALYRAGKVNSLSSVNELSDLTSEELQAFKAGRRHLIQPSGGGSASVRVARPTPVPSCCTYDQVYETIIDLLNRTNTQVGALKQSRENSRGNLNLVGNADLTGMIRAYIEELEQKPIISEQGVGSNQENISVARQSSKNRGDAQIVRNFSPNEQSAAESSAGRPPTSEETTSSRPTEGYLEAKEATKLLREPLAVRNEGGDGTRSAQHEGLLLSDGTSPFLRKPTNFRPERKQSTLMGNSKGVKSSTFGGLSQRPSHSAQQQQQSQQTSLLGRGATLSGLENNNKKSLETGDAQPIEQSNSGRNSSSGSITKEFNQTGAQKGESKFLESARIDPESDLGSFRGKAGVTSASARAATLESFAAQKISLNRPQNETFSLSPVDGPKLPANSLSVDLEKGRAARVNLAPFQDKPKSQSDSKDNRAKAGSDDDISDGSAFESAIIKQYMEQLSSKELSKRFSAHFGEPVSIETSIDTSGKDSNSAVAEKPKAVLLRRRKRHENCRKKRKQTRTIALSRSVESLAARVG